MIREKELLEQIDIALSRPGSDSYSVLMVADRLEIFGGLETYIYGICKELKNKGHNVILNCSYISQAMAKMFSSVRVLVDENEEAVRKLIIDEKIDVIHAHPFKSAQRALRLYRLTGVRRKRVPKWQLLFTRQRLIGII